MLKYFSIFLFLILIPFSTSAHPGRTASDGCHYCRSNCDSWGVPYNERHCHNGGSSSYNSTSGSNLVPILPPKTDYTTLNTVTATVESITDGDTIKIKISGDTNIYPVRLIGIDTPETVDPRKPVQCFGKEATEKMRSLVDKKTITLKRDAVNDNKDKYDRLLRYVYLDDMDINAEMIKQGYAYAYLKYSFESAKMNAYKNYENQAKENQLGLWAPGVCGNDIEPKVLGTESENIAEEINQTASQTQTVNTEKSIAPPITQKANSNTQNNKEDDFFGTVVFIGILSAIGIWAYKKIKK